MPAKPRKIVLAQGGVAIANHCVIVNLLCIVNLLRRSIFSMAGSFGSAAKSQRLEKSQRLQDANLGRDMGGCKPKDPSVLKTLRHSIP